jgi:hypothetical protein
MTLIAYRPAFQSQNPAKSGYKYGWQSCTAFSTAMAVDRATIGGTLVTGGYIRSITNEPVPSPNDPGLTLDQVIAAAAKLHVVIVNKTGHTFDDAMLDMKNRRGIILCGLYSEFGDYSSQTSFKGAHAVYVNNIDGSGANGLTYDPLANAERWIPLTILRSFSEKLYGHPHQIMYASTRATPFVDSNTVGQ